MVSSNRIFRRSRLPRLLSGGLWSSAALFGLSLFVIAPSASYAAGELQKAIDDASEFATVKLGPGLYEGNIVIRKPLTLVATQPSAVIKGDGKGSVVTVESSYVTIEGLEIINSGGEHQTIDSGIAVKNGFNVKIKNNKIHECLFGVNLEKSNNCVVEDNQISSKKLSLGLRGDGIRLWYSHSNLIIKNHTFQVRDNVFWYSSGNTVEKISAETPDTPCISCMPIGTKSWITIFKITPSVSS